ncbi:probable E3 ubiquitin-protein ligase TRIML2 isoform X1 [Fukomys damarensis]|uniref:probable E3 ubiquitin-protein ligase TRIML2 isoform X1 n=2 Tax=Fukomys damarensis TaxID=885580 RepID=UPI00053FEA89|nr:probable E3 ubiquitin-protein ligase TRIML2 isoform X1 [Fukomys damarensis]
MGRGGFLEPDWDRALIWHLPCSSSSEDPEVTECTCSRRGGSLSTSSCSEFRKAFCIGHKLQLGTAARMSKGCRPQVQHSVTEDAFCETHLEPLELFCDDDQVTLCSKGLRAQDHKHHTVYDLQVAAEKYRKLFQEVLNLLREKVEVAKSILADEQERMKMIQEEEQNFKEVIESEYRIRFQLLREENEMIFLRLRESKFDLNLREANENQLMRLATELEEKSQEMLQRLDSWVRENTNKLKESETEVSEHLCSLQELTTELQKKCGHPAAALLQNARYCLERNESLLLQSLVPARITDLCLCQIKRRTKILTVHQKHITLDPNTAHPCLALSEDLRTVRFRNIQQDVPGNPGTFDFSASVLGAESFHSGKHYWEVAVAKASQWQLGVYGDYSAAKKDNVPEALPDKFLLIGSMMGPDYTFWVFPPLKRVCLQKEMRKVGVFLDYEHGHISFYNVTERSLIYNFSRLSFQGAVRPLFSLCIPNGDMNSDSLTICPPHVPS